MDKYPTLKPVGDNILIERIAPPESSSGGIYIPEAMRDGNWTEARVVARGGGKMDTRKGCRVAAPVEPGDKVFVNKWAGQEIALGPRVLKMIKQDDIMMVMPDEPAAA